MRGKLTRRRPGRRKAAGSNTAGSLFSQYQPWILGFLLLVVTLLAYQPAWHGGAIWDDETRLISPEIRPFASLSSIWLQPNTGLQYHPLVDTVFWLGDKLWGNATFGFHLLNILLHVGSALLLWRILRRLAVPGAWFAAAIFALHPVQVESVAWIVELKNTLSGFLFFGAILAYLNFDENRSRRWYVFVLLLFVLGLLAKPVVATFPVVILILLWWKNRRLDPRRDFQPLIPFFVTGIVAGLFTAWMERKFSGAEGGAFALPLIERILIAGRAFWFYLGKLFWPGDLVMIYPRWEVSRVSWWQYLFPITALALFYLLWKARRRAPSVWAALLFFAVSIFPFIGFFNVYYFKFSFVADHFQYLASAGIIILVAAGATVVVEGLQGWRRPVARGYGVALLVILAVLTWRQSRAYASPEIYYRTILSRNSDSPTAHNNLGETLLAKGKAEEARSEYEKAVQSQPDYAFGHYNLSVVLLKMGKRDEAIEHLRKVLEINPNHAKASYSYANILAERGEIDAAIARYEKAVQSSPDFVEAYINMGSAYLGRGDADSALRHYEKAVKLAPDYATAHYNLAAALFQKNELDQAIEQFQEALRIRSDYPDADYFLGNALLEKGRLTEAIAHWQRSLEIQPDNALAANSLAWVFATSRSAAVRDGAKAVDLAQRANTITPDPLFLRTLAAAYAEAGRFRDAIETAQRAAEAVRSLEGSAAFIDQIEKDLASYRGKEPLRDTRHSR